MPAPVRADLDRIVAAVEENPFGRAEDYAVDVERSERHVGRALKHLVEAGRLRRRKDARRATPTQRKPHYVYWCE